MTRYLSIFLALVFSTTAFAKSSDQEALEKAGAKIRLQNGTIIDLQGSCNKWTDAEFRLVGKQVGLKNLHLSGKTITNKTLQHLTGLKNIESILLNNAQLTDEDFKFFQSFPELKRLSLYHQSREIANFDGSGLKHLKPLKNLKQLTFAGAKTGNIAMEAISKLTQLESYSQWHNLETAEGIKQLLKLKDMKSLRIGQRLHDWKPPIKPPSFNNATFSLIAQMESLETLEIMEARLSYSALIKLKELPHLKKIKVRLIDTPDEEIAKLKKELPHVKIEWQSLTEQQEQSTLVKKLKI